MIVIDFTNPFTDGVSATTPAVGPASSGQSTVTGYGSSPVTTELNLPEDTRKSVALKKVIEIL